MGAAVHADHQTAVATRVQGVQMFPTGSLLLNDAYIDE